jgi:hypothetical protein
MPLRVREHEVIRAFTTVSYPFEQNPSELNRERNQPLFAPLAEDCEEEIVEVNICDSEAQQFGNSGTCVEKEQHNKMETTVVKPSWSPIDEAFDLL